MSKQQQTKIQHVIETLILVVCSSCSYRHLIFQPSFNLTKSKYVNLGPKTTNHILTIRFPNSSFKNKSKSSNDQNDISCSSIQPLD